MNEWLEIHPVMVRIAGALISACAIFTFWGVLAVQFGLFNYHESESDTDI